MAFDQERFRDRLLELGFDEVRFAAAGRVPEPYRGRFLDWLERGDQADMAWIERAKDKRLDPDLVLPGVRSVILLGVNYLPSDDVARNQERWAKYALYEDYHDTIKKALVDAGRLIEEETGHSSQDYRYYVDTGPMMERGLAARAGLGWQGKNGMLISRTHGNWLFLSAILSRYPFRPDKPLENLGFGSRNDPASGDVGLFCGGCTRCMEACPTEAISRPGVVDARLCISYQTIENKGIIPRELRSKIGTRIFGCDICLDVCPWNRFAREGKQLLLHQRSHLAALSLVEILGMSREDFSRVFARTPIKRLKWRGLLRNACVVAGNLRDRTAPVSEEEVAEIMTLLVRLASHEEPMVRAHAVWAVRRLAGERAGEWLGEVRNSETDQAVLAEY